METIYKLVEDVDLNEFAKRGYDLLPNTLTMVKIIEQPEDGEAVKYLLYKYYTNKDWIEQIYNKNKKEIKDTIGLRYYENGDIRYTKKLRTILTNWRIEIDAADGGWLGFASLDPFDRLVYYGKGILDKYCKQEVDELLELGLIEEVEVNNEGGHLEQ
jgi:hypothetical protein